MISLTFDNYPPLCVVPSQTAIFLYLHSQVHLLLLQRVPLGFLLLLFVTMYVFQLKSTMQVTVRLDHGAPWPRSIGSSFICSQIVRVCSSTPWPLDQTPLLEQHSCVLSLTSYSMYFYTLVCCNLV